jgi:zinc transport system ATP-binding protein
VFVMPVLVANHLRFAFAANPVIDDVSFTIGECEFVALVGPNGAGKSTLIRLLLGLLAPAAGSVELFGDDPRRLRDRWRIGYVPQRPSLAPDLPATVEEIVTAGRLARTGWRGRLRSGDRAAIDHALDEVDLGELRGRRVVELSGGQQQRAFIAKALAAQPEFLIADEPIAGVDAESQRRFRDSLTHMVREHGGAVLLVSHELGAVADALDRVIVLKNKVMFDGPPRELSATGVSLGIHADDLPLWLEGLQ